jgi:hypothetical protein
MINQKEVRNLLIDSTWPVDYYDESLDKVAENIIQEFDKLRAGDSFLKSIQEKDIKINQDARLSILRSVNRLFEINPDEAKRVIETCNLEQKTKEDVARAIRNREFDMQVKAMHEKNLATNKEITFEDIMSPIVVYFKMSFASVRDITAKEFCSLENQYKNSLKAEK